MMKERWRDVLGDNLAINLELRVAPSARSITAGDSAARLFEAIALLEEGGQTHSKDEPPAPELQRLEIKIDLLTDLASSLLADRIPQGSAVIMSADGLVLRLTGGAGIGAGCAAG